MPGTALHKSRPEASLQRHQITAGGGNGYIQSPSRLADATKFGNANKKFYFGPQESRVLVQIFQAEFTPRVPSLLAYSMQNGPRFELGAQSEQLEALEVLPFADEFREDIGFPGIHKKFRQALAQGVGHDELGRRNSRADGPQP